MSSSNVHLLPPAPGTCNVCATKHDEGQPHNRNSLYYQTHYLMTHDRNPTWYDAMAHCTYSTQQTWLRELKERGEKLD
jgi:hypothetical protein